MSSTNTARSGLPMLFAIFAAIFIVPTSISGTGIALPAIASDTSASLAKLQWVVNAFNLAFACFTLVWGALADRFGRRRCFAAGVVIYSLASLLSAASSSTILLDLSRAVAGTGAAAVFSCGIAILSVNFSGRARTKVFAIFGTVAGLGVSVGPTISGVMLDALGWRSVFYVHAIVLGIVAACYRVVPADARSSEPSDRSFDVCGAVLFISALLAMMFAIVQSSQWGWLDGRTIVMLCASVLMFIGFYYWERAVKDPVLDLQLLRNGPFVAYALIPVAGSFGFVTLLTYLPTYLTSVVGMSATHAGITMLMLTAPMLVCPMAAGRLASASYSGQRILLVSLLLLIAGTIWVYWAIKPEVDLFLLSPGLLAIGAGFGLAAGLVDGLALQVVSQEKVGMAAGLVNTFRLGSEAIAVSLYGSTVAAFFEHFLRESNPVLRLGNDGLRRWMDEVAAGNFDAAFPVLSTDDAHIVRQSLPIVYDQAFHAAVLLVASVVCVLAFVICVFIPRKT